MDLSQEISLSSLFKKKDKAKKSGAAQLKTYINFADVAKEKTTNWALAIPGIAAVAVIVGLFAYFGVIQRLNAQAEASSEVAALQERYDTDMAIINGSDELSDNFYHYTYTDMTDEEQKRLSRVEVAQILDFINSQGITVNAANLRDTLLTVQVSGTSLEEVSRMTEAVWALNTVESCVMTSAQTWERETTPTAISMSEDEGDEEQPAAPITISGVDAELNIYIANKETQADMEGAGGAK